MKVRRSVDKVKFSPVKIEIVIETELEYDWFKRWIDSKVNVIRAKERLSKTVMSPGESSDLAMFTEFIWQFNKVV